MVSHWRFEYYPTTLANTSMADSDLPPRKATDGAKYAYFTRIIIATPSSSLNDRIH
jgi:hypothetical protein